MARLPAGNDFDGWVSSLARPGSRRGAKVHLLRAGSAALPALRRGVRHADPTVRQACVNLLDHLVDEASIPDLVAALDDDDAAVRARALHALACDACKQNECRPADDLFVPRAFELLAHDDARVRAAAIDALGKVVLRRPDLVDAVAAAVGRERDPGLRAKAVRTVVAARRTPKTRRDERVV